VNGAIPIDEVWNDITSFANLRRAARRAARGKRQVKGVARFLLREEPELLALQRELGDGSWRPGRPATFVIRDPKERVITAAPFRDRVVHHALIDPLEPLLDACLLPHAFACRRGKGQHRAVPQAQALLRQHAWFLKMDVAKFFPSLAHDVVLATVDALVADARTRALFSAIVRGGGAAECGLPIGHLTSQWLANLVLGRLDAFVVCELRAGGYVRYMDDFVVFGASKRELRAAHDAIVVRLAALRLAPKARATMLAPGHVGLPYLGWRIYRGTVRVRPENLRRSRRRIATREAQWRRGLLDERQLADAVRSVIAHLRHGSTLALRRAWLGGAAIGQDADTGTDPRLLVEPRQPRRQLQRRRPQRAVQQPQQERADEPQHEPRRAPRQDVTQPDGAVAGIPARPRSAP